MARSKTKTSAAPSGAQTNASEDEATKTDTSEAADAKSPKTDDAKKESAAAAASEPKRGDTSTDGAGAPAPVVVSEKERGSIALRIRKFFNRVVEAGLAEPKEADIDREVDNLLQRAGSVSEARVLLLEQERELEAAIAARAAEEDSARSFDYVVAKGKSVTTKRGIRGEGKVVLSRDFTGGEDRLDALVDAGVVERRRRKK